MVRVDPNRVSAGAEIDTREYDEVNFEDVGYLQEGTYEVIHLWGFETDKPGKGVSWGLKVGAELPMTDGTSVKGHWVIWIQQKHRNRWANMLKVLDPGLFADGVARDISPENYVGLRYRVRMGYSEKGDGDKLWPQKILPLVGGDEEGVPAGAANPGATTTLEGVDENDLPF